MVEDFGVAVFLVVETDGEDGGLGFGGGGLCLEFDEDLDDLEEDEEGGAENLGELNGREGLEEEEGVGEVEEEGGVEEQSEEGPAGHEDCREVEHCEGIIMGRVIIIEEGLCLRLQR